ncbi:ImpA family type VI secretion system protein, partial [Sphingomonas bacterium]|uniref:type VI secretion system protein TssA n=1 Tax=Sphingomonas bacterium TaxID=1895847 RepID=UPI0015758EE9
LAAGDPDLDPLVAGLRAWEAVAAGATRLLAEQGKDLQVAAWLVEAWLRTDGLPGLADGFTLLVELVTGYWHDGLHPFDPDDEADARLAPLFGLFGREEAGTLIQPLRLLPLTDAPDRHVALWTLEAVRGQSIRHDDPVVREELSAKHAQRVQQLEGAVAAASPDFAATNLAASERALAELDRLMTALDERTDAGRFGSQVAVPLTALADAFGRGRADAPLQIVAEALSLPTTSAAEPAEGRPETAPKQNPLDRRGALATLIEIAGFFDRTEPQSLIGHGLRDLVRRANLPLDELIGELIPDRDQRAMFMLRAGIRVEPAGDGGGGVTTF